MRHARLELWSRGASFAHRRHPAAKLLLALVFLICIATLRPEHRMAALAFYALLCSLTVGARLPLYRVQQSAAVVLPFALVFALISVAAGTPERGVAIVVRAFLSSYTTVLLAATTPLPDLLAGLETLQAPRFLVQVMQFLYRYLLVLLEEARAMRDAALSRAGTVGALGFRRAASMVGVLFARAWQRANATHRAMTARGFAGHFPPFRVIRPQPADALLVIPAAALAIAIRVAAQ